MQYFGIKYILSVVSWSYSITTWNSTGQMELRTLTLAVREKLFQRLPFTELCFFSSIRNWEIRLVIGVWLRFFYHISYQIFKRSEKQSVRKLTTLKNHIENEEKTLCSSLNNYDCKLIKPDQDFTFDRRVHTRVFLSLTTVIAKDFIPVWWKMWSWTTSQRTISITLIETAYTSEDIMKYSSFCGQFHWKAKISQPYDVFFKGQRHNWSCLLIVFEV